VTQGPIGFFRSIEPVKVLVVLGRHYTQFRGRSSKYPSLGESTLVAFDVEQLRQDEGLGRSAYRHQRIVDPCLTFTFDPVDDEGPAVIQLQIFAFV
jgi:hypothetical protein